MAVKDQVVLVTGGTGFVGSHIILQLLERGYHVKAPVRTGKKEHLLSTYAQAGDRLEAIEITDIVEDDLSAAFVGVHSFIHVASPLHFSGDAEYILKTAIKGTENVLKQAIDAGVKKIVLTGSWASLFEPDLKKAFYPETCADETWWSGVKMEDATSQKRDSAWGYMASKPLAEKAAWELAENSDVDLTSVLPPIIYGPYVPNYPPAKDRSGLGTNEWIYHLITGDADGSKTYPRMGAVHFVSVKDVAKIHVLALESGPIFNEDGVRRRKRLITVGGSVTWPEAVAYLKEARPALRQRLEKDEGGPKHYSCCKVDMKMTKEVVGMGEEDMVPWQECFTETVDCLLKWEQGIKERA